MTEVWPPPDALVEHLRSSSRDGAVYEHAISVRTGWWNAQKDLPGGPVRATGDNEVQKICRADLFRLAEGAVNDKSGTSAQSLLWHTLAWGTGLKHRNNKRRIKSVLEKPDGALLLRDAALASREDPAAAFRMLRPGRHNAFAWLGPNFFTKYLYFAGGGNPDHPSLILDQYVRAALDRETGKDGRFRYISQYSVGDYVEALSQLKAWATVASTSTGRPVAPDEVERWAFSSS
jgi:hypothetical protein